MNNMDKETIIKKGNYLWACGANEKRALSVQKKETTIDAPLVSRIPLTEQ